MYKFEALLDRGIGDGVFLRQRLKLRRKSFDMLTCLFGFLNFAFLHLELLDLLFLEILLLLNNFLNFFLVVIFDLGLVALHLVVTDLALVVVLKPLADVPRLRKRIHRDDSKIIPNKELLLPFILIVTYLFCRSNGILVFASMIFQA